MKVRIFAVVLTLATLGAVVIGMNRGIVINRSVVVDSERTFPDQYAGIVAYNLAAFDRNCTCAPNIAAHYVHIGGSTGMAIARSILAAGAVPMLELEPYGLSMAQISAGAEDAWLARYARAVRYLNVPVIMSFAPEANGNWYSWSYPYVPAQDFVSAWRHVVTVFRKAGAANVRWAWIMNVNFPGSENIRLLWPGRAFVDILGLDGYFLKTTSFESVFGPTIVSMRSISAAPILITETAAAPAAGKLQALHELIAGVARYALEGFVWFDVPQRGSITRQDWRLEDVPAALALFSDYARHVR